MRSTSCLLLTFLMFTGCRKSSIDLPGTRSTDTSGFTQYIIPAGQHYCNQSSYRAVETSEMKFLVKFDSSAIYTTVDPANQEDINKLFGLSDNGMDHHQYSARFGWRWSGGALRLFAYVYNNAVVESKELTSITLGAEITCTIRILQDHYLFIVNDIQESLPRVSTTPKGKGYQLFPYFGGDEVAPHTVNIWMKEGN